MTSIGDAPTALDRVSVRPIEGGWSVKWFVSAGAAIATAFFAPLRSEAEPRGTACRAGDTLLFTPDASAHSTPIPVMRYVTVKALAGFQVAAPSSGCTPVIEEMKKDSNLLLFANRAIAAIPPAATSAATIATASRDGWDRPIRPNSVIFKPDQCPTMLPNVIDTVRIAFGRGCAILRRDGASTLLHLRFLDQTDADVLKEPIVLPAGRTYTGVSTDLWALHIIAGSVEVISHPDGSPTLARVDSYRVLIREDQ